MFAPPHRYSETVRIRTRQMKGRTCDECKSMCERPCWPTPRGAERLIRAGYGARLMLDLWVGQNGESIYVLCPANVGSEGQRARPRPIGKCTFQMPDGLCEVHGSLKPIEGRVVGCNGRNIHDIHHRIAMAWNTLGGRVVVQAWKETNGEA